jgi:HKD family nuclease
MFDMIEMMGHSGHDLRSSIVLTYSLELTLYDGLIRRALNRAGVWNQIIFCDFSCYIQDIQSQTAASYAGKHYSVTPIWQSGAFHPKVYMLLGPRNGRLLIGSGNATIGGLIRNAEIFGQFEFDAEKEKSPHAAFPSIFNFVEELGARASDPVRKQIKSAKQMAPWLSSPTIEDGREVLIGGPGKPELLKQILACLPAKKVDGLVVCSSSFDRSLSGMRSLASLSKARPVCIVQPEHVEFDGQAVRKLGTIVDWRRFIDPYQAEKRQRKDACAHAKLLVFGHGDTETCVFGSANASAPALNSTNTEVAVVLAPRSKGEIVKHLNLSASLNGENIQKELADKEWDPTQEERPESRFSCLLSAVAVEELRYRLILASGIPPKASCLALSDREIGRAHV